MRVIGWTFFWVVIAPGLMMAAIELMAPKERLEAEPAAVASVAEEPDYADRVASMLGALSSMQAADYTQSMDMIGLALGWFRAAAQVVDDGAGLALADSAEAGREALRRELSRRQAVILPVLRDALGPILRQTLWADNGSAKTIGAGFRTVELVSPAFAANRNIQEVQQELQALLVELRFSRAQYRWFEGAEEVQFYRMEPPADDEVVIWLEDGRWRLAG